MYPLRTKFFSRDKKNLKRSPDGRAPTKWRIFLKFLLSDSGNVKIVHFFSFELFYCYKIFKFFVWKLFNAWGLKFPHFFNWWYWDCQSLFYINFQQKELFISKQLARKKALKAHIHPPWYLSFFEWALSTFFLWMDEREWWMFCINLHIYFMWQVMCMKKSQYQSRMLHPLDFIAITLGFKVISSSLKS